MLLVSLLFSLAVVKGWLVNDVFMGLRRVPIFWRSIMLAWLVVICALLALIYALTLKYSMKLPRDDYADNPMQIVQ